MKTRSILLALLVCLFAVSLGFAENPNMGTWKLNEAKSKFAPGMMKNTTVTYTAAGDSVKVTTDGTAGDGSPLKTEWTGMFDGKDYPLTGDTTANTRAYTKVNDHTMTLENRKDGKVVTSGKIVVSADGKTRTLTTSGMNAAGKKISGTAVYDKE